MDVKMNLRIITKNLAADAKKVPLQIDFRADWTHESNATAWELMKRVFFLFDLLLTHFAFNGPQIISQNMYGIFGFIGFNHSADVAIVFSIRSDGHKYRVLNGLETSTCYSRKKNHPSMRKYLINQK